MASDFRLTVVITKSDDVYLGYIPRDEGYFHVGDEVLIEKPGSPSVELRGKVIMIDDYTSMEEIENYEQKTNLKRAMVIAIFQRRDILWEKEEESDE